jgi:hypothetical protein
MADNRWQMADGTSKMANGEWLTRGRVGQNAAERHCVSRMTGGPILI